MTTLADLQTAAFLDDIIEYCEQQFPRPCSHCGREFPSFLDFVESTSPIGAPQVYDTVEELVHDGVHPIGSISYVNCACGSTLAVDCGDTSSDRYQGLLAAIAGDAERTGLRASDVLGLLREEIRARVTR